jgi:uncharacterized protein YchJ
VGSAEGVDPSDRVAVARFMEDFNKRVAENPDLLPMPGFKVVRPKAWTWKPANPKPELAGPCPCGIGRRYKKCCLPR